MAQANWDLIQEIFIKHGVDDEGNLAAACATVAVETGLTFKPEKEQGDDAYFTSNYYFNAAVRKALGNTSPGDAIRFCGRGFIQVTGRFNYVKASEAIGINLLVNPELACIPKYASEILWWYWNSRSLVRLGRQVQQDTKPVNKLLIYQEIRRRVNGGLSGLTVYLEVLKDLHAL